MKHVRNVRWLARSPSRSGKTRRLFREPLVKRRACAARDWQRTLGFDPRVNEMFERRGSFIETECSQLFAHHEERLAALDWVVPAGLSLVSNSPSLTLRTTCERQELDSWLAPRTRR